MPDAAFMLAQIGVRRVQQAHAGRHVPVPADEAVPLFDEAAPVFPAGGRLSLPGEELRVPQALLVREEQLPVALGELEHGDLRAQIEALKAPAVVERIGDGLDGGHVAHGPEGLVDILRPVGDDVAQVQIVGLEALGKLPDAAEAGDVVPHDDGRHAEPDLRAPAQGVEGLQVAQHQAEIAADLDLAVILIELVDGDPDARDAGVQQLPGLPLRQQRPVGDQLHLLSPGRGQRGHGDQRRMDQRLAHAAEEDGPGFRQHGIVQQAREDRRVQIAHALADPAVAKAHLAGQIAAGGGLHVEFSDSFFHVILSRRRGGPYRAEARSSPDPCSAGRPRRAFPSRPRDRPGAGRRAPSAARRRRAA